MTRSTHPMIREDSNMIEDSLYEPGSTEMLVANESGWISDGDTLIQIQKDQTRVHAGHEVVRRNPGMFKRLGVHYGIEIRQEETEESETVETPELGEPEESETVETPELGEPEESETVETPELGEPVDLKGAELDAALDAAGLVKTGSAGEKRARLAEHLAKNADES